MEFEITQAGTKNYYDEVLFIGTNLKKLRAKPQTKIRKQSLSALQYLLVSVAILILFALLYSSSRAPVQLAVVILFSLLTAGSIGYLLLIRRSIRKFVSQHKPCVLRITADAVSLESDRQTYTLRFDEIRCPVCGENAVALLPEDPQKKFLATRIAYKDALLDAWRAYEKHPTA